MVLVWFATEQNGALSADLEKEDISEKLAGIEKLLDAHLKES
jgi:hypothetical protein